MTPREPTRPLRRRHLARLSCIGFAAVALLAGTAAAASAHAALVSTSPSQSARYAAGSPPSTVTVTFDDDVTTTPRSVEVYDGSGRAMNVTPVHTSNAKVVAARLAKVPDGSYAVVWHIVSDDGHPETGAFTFSVGAATAQAANLNSLEARQRAGSGVGIGFGIVRFLEFFASLTLVGALLFGRWRWPSTLSRRALRRTLLGVGALGFLATLASISLEAAYSSGGGASTMVRWSALRQVLEARFGTAALWRAGLIVALAGYAIAPVARRRATRVVTELPLALLGLGIGASFAYAGHGYTGRWPAFGFALDVTHLTAAALWLGGLVLLSLTLRGRDEAQQSVDALHRFSRVALPAIAVVVVSGALQGWRQIGTWNALWHTAYARLLIIKVLVVLAIVVLASASRDAVRDRLLRRHRRPPGPRPLVIELDGPGGGSARGSSGTTVTASRKAATAVDLWDVQDAPGDPLLREVRIGILLEAGLAAIVLAVTSILVVTPPGREAEAAAKVPQPQTIRLTAQGRTLAYAVAVQPTLAGENTLVVHPRLVGGTGLLPTSVSGLVRAAGSLRSTRVTFTALANGDWVAVAPLDRAGAWAVELDGATPSASETTTFPITVR